MKIIFAGTSHGVPEKGAFCTSTFIEVDGKVYIIDGGAPVSELLLENGLAHKDVRSVFLTHKHCDHMAGLFEFATQISWYYLDSHPKFFFPEQDAIDLVKQVVRFEVGDREQLDMNHYGDGFAYDDGTIQVSSRRTDHLANSFAFSVEANGKKVLFTGDMSYRFAEFERICNNESFDLVVCEGAHFDEQFDINILKNANTRRMLINHINPMKKTLLEPLKRLAEFDFDFAYDGLTLDI